MNVDGVYNFIIPSGFQIRVSYYSGGVEAQYFVFDAVGANKLDGPVDIDCWRPAMISRHLEIQ